MLFRNNKNSATCAMILGLAVLLPGTASSLTAESLISSVAVTAAASENSGAQDAPLAPASAAVESAQPAGPVIQAPEPPSSIVSAIGFLYLCAGFFVFKPRRRMSHADAPGNRTVHFNR